MFAPLDGVRVIDLTHVLAGPYCTNLLATMGASVIKVEPPGLGDLTRHTGPVPALNKAGMGLTFCTQNGDKASVAVDLKQPEGIEIIHRLVGAVGDPAGADELVFVENFRPGVAERLGIGFERLRAIRPDLVYVSITAYGQDGPIGHRPAYDHVVQAMSGIMETTGTEETGPVKVGAPFVDYATGQKAALATMAAVMERRRTGEPQRVDCAMLDTTLLTMANTLTSVANTGDRPPKLGNQAASRAASSGTFATADGLLAIAANNDRQFADLCRVIDRADLIDDDRFRSARDRQTNAADFQELLIAVLAGNSAAAWEERFDRAGVPAARVRSVDQVLGEGQPEARGLLAEAEVAGLTVKLPTAGFKVNGRAPANHTAPPELGADADRILTDLGYEADRIAELRSSGVI